VRGQVLWLVPRRPLELHLALKNMRVSKNAHYRVLGSEMGLKGVAGDTETQCRVTRHVYREPLGIQP